MAEINCIFAADGHDLRILRQNNCTFAVHTLLSICTRPTRMLNSPRWPNNLGAARRGPAFRRHLKHPRGIPASVVCRASRHPQYLQPSGHPVTRSIATFGHPVTRSICNLRDVTLLAVSVASVTSRHPSICGIRDVTSPATSSASAGHPRHPVIAPHAAFFISNLSSGR